MQETIDDEVKLTNPCFTNLNNSAKECAIF